MRNYTKIRYILNIFLNKRYKEIIGFHQRPLDGINRTRYDLFSNKVPLFSVLYLKLSFLYRYAKKKLKINTKKLIFWSGVSCA